MSNNLTILQLPVDVLINILKRLSLPDIKNVMLTCKTLQSLIKNDNFLWKYLSTNLLILHNASNE